MKVWATIEKALARNEVCTLVTVARTEGSAPREAGARMIVLASGFHGTIGGGALEWRAIAAAQSQMGNGVSVRLSDHALGPDLGQCCGGRVTLLTEVFDRSMAGELRALVEAEVAGRFECESTLLEDRVRRVILPSPLAGEGGAQRRMRGPLRATDAHRSGGEAPSSVAHSRDTFSREGRRGIFVEMFGESRRVLYLFGAGHVGRALVLALAPLPFEVRWIDPRPEAFPAMVPANVVTVRGDDPPAELAEAADDAFVLIMTHSHALDLAITEAALKRPFRYVGLIGSASKRARFLRRLRQAGIAESRLAELVCPIGAAGIRSKHPAAIAAGTAAQLLERDEAARDGSNFVSNVIMATA